VIATDAWPIRRDTRTTSRPAAISMLP
jgi:hypothetical protein